MTRFLRRPRARTSAPRRPVAALAALTAGGAVLLTGNGEPVYILGLAMWPDQLQGKHVSATGRLKHIKHIPDPHQGADGAISQGAVGKQFVLQKASWQAL